MNKDKFLLCIKALILLSPLTFGCVTRIWSPLFYLVVLVVSGMALGGIQERIEILYEKKIRLLGGLFFAYTLFQMVPLPRFLLNILSPSTVELLDGLSAEPVLFHSLSLVPADTLMFVMRLMVMGLFFWVLMHQDLKKQEMFSLIHVLTISAFFQVGLGLIKWLLRSDHFFLFFYKTGNTSRFMNGTFLSPDHLAFYLQMIFPLVIGLMLVKLYIERPWDSMGIELWRVFLKNRVLIFYALVSLGTVGGIVLSKSVSGRMILFLSVCLMAVGFIYFRVKLISMSHQTLRWVVLVITLLAILFALQSTMSDVNRADREGNVRSDFWQDSWKVYSQFPIFGIGNGNFKNISFQCRTRRDESKLVHPYNEVLEHLVGGGILGFGVFMAFLGLLLVSLFRMWKQRQHPEVRVMGLAILVSILTAGFHELFDFALRTPANGFIFVLILSIGFKMVLYKRKSRHET